MKKLTILLAFMLSVTLVEAQFFKITKKDFEDKVKGYWYGQLVGNYMGFPFEVAYIKEPMPFIVDRYYSFKDVDKTKVYTTDTRGFTNVLCFAFNGAWTDDDTDIEFVTLSAVEQYGLGITYPQIAEYWKKSINRNIWCANEAARKLMDKGLVPPETGNKKNNAYWYAIDPQLVNEIWSVFYPCMVNKAAEKAEWGAKITNDDWGTHATVAYGVMYSAAFKEKDTKKLVNLTLNYLPDGSPMKDGIKDLIAWNKQYPNDWRQCRQLMHEKYYKYKDLPVSDVSSLINGLAGIMAILYGEGDFMKTTGLACSIGYDCDNQAATCAGLMGVIGGIKVVPDSLTKEIKGFVKWDKPFNDTYFNYSRDNLPTITKISDIINRIVAISEKSIVANGGKIQEENGETVYLIKE